MYQLYIRTYIYCVSDDMKIIKKTTDKIKKKFIFAFQFCS
jgi:hypothetical protein